MGEEKKEPEEKKEGGENKEEEKKEEEKKDEKKDESKEEKEDEPLIITLKVDMHCEACARKVKKSLMGFSGVEDVEVDVKSHKVTVKGKAADPVKVCERVQKKSGRKTELISPLPKTEEEKKPDENKKEEEKKEPAVVTVVLKVHMHCEGCAQEVRRVILKMNGVQAAEPDLKDQKVTVKGTMDPLKLVEHVSKRTGKHAEIVPQKDPEGDQKKEDEKKEGGDKKDEGDDKDDKKQEVDAETKGGDGGGDDKKVESKKNEISAPKYVIEYIPAPQIFSDENPNACSVM